MITLLSILIVLALLLINAFMINPHQIQVREEVIKSTKIDDKADGLLIAFFSDLHYGHNFKEDDLDKLVSKMNAFSPDIIIFGGDLLSDMESGDLEVLKEGLGSLKAGYGKYAVLGDKDVLNAQSEDILRETNFTILQNKNEKIYVDGAFINIVGVDPSVNGDPDTVIAYEGVNPVYYTFAVSHCPDIASTLQLDKTDYILSGHSLGGPVYLPVINYFYRPLGAEKWFHGKNWVSGTKLDISNGAGTINKDIRLFADAEIVLYKLKKQ